MSESDTFGGSSDTPCFALLDGRVTDPDTEETSSFQLPLTKLPAVLGRSHETDNPNFFGLGKRKALSRKQCVIYYQDAKGGCVEWDQHSLAYKKEGSWNFQKSKLKTPVDQLPEEGFFLIECLGRNSITVNRTKVEQGECMVLESGSPIRISQHKLYFLLPTDAPPRKHLIQEESKKKKGTKRPSPSSPSVSGATKKPKGTGLAAYTELLESMSTQELLDEMTNAIAANTWDRKNQMVGTVLVLRAVKDAAKASEIMELAKDNGVARSRVIEWIEKSSKYKRFVEQLQSKIEPRSYQAAITKAVIKAGYTRNGTAGRYVKWHLPPADSDDDEEEEAPEDQEEDEDEDENAEDQEEEQEDEENDEAGDDNENDDEQEEEDDDEEGGDNENDVDMDETEHNNEDEQVDEGEENEEEEEDDDDEQDDGESNQMEADQSQTEKSQDDEELSESNREEDDNDLDKSLDVEDKTDGDDNDAAGEEADAKEKDGSNENE